MLSLCARLARQHGASRLARRLTSLAGPNEAALARAPSVLREYILCRPVSDRKASKAGWRAFESEGMEKVLGIGPEVLEELRLRVDSAGVTRLSSSEKMESWNKITKGGDIFIPGLPKFDIMQAYAALVLDEARARSVGWPFWLVSVRELQAVGHFPALRHDQREHIVRILDVDSCPVRQHLITYHEWWNNEENANALDELARVAGWYDISPTYRRWASDWPEGGEKLKPPTLLRRLREAELRRQLGPDIHFTHLDCIADPPAEGKLALRVLRRSHHIAHVAKQLSNCARSYIGRVKRGRYVLVGAFEGEEPKALAGYAAGGAGWDHRPVLFGNKNVDGGTGALFDAFLPALENWTPAAAPPEYEDEDWDEYVFVEEDEDNWDEYEEPIAAINGERGVAAMRAAMGWTTD